MLVFEEVKEAAFSQEVCEKKALFHPGEHGVISLLIPGNSAKVTFLGW